MKSGELAILLTIELIVLMIHFKVRHIERTVDALAKEMQVEVEK